MRLAHRLERRADRHVLGRLAREGYVGAEVWMTIADGIEFVMSGLPVVGFFVLLCRRSR